MADDDDPQLREEQHDEVVPDETAPSTEGGQPKDDGSAFDAGWELEEGVATDDEPAPSEPAGEDTGGADTSIQDAEASDDEEAASEGQSEEAAHNDEPPKPEDVERVKQELKTWQGRAKKAREEAEAAERELEAKRKAAKEATEATDGGDEPGQDGGETQQQRETRERVEASLGKEDREFLEAAAEDYPDIYRMLDLMTRERGMTDESIQQRVQKAVEPVQEQVARQQQEAHVARIKEVHEDMDELLESGAVTEWIESQPYKDAQRWLEVYERGTTDEVISLLGEVKKSQAKPAGEKPSGDAKRQQQLAAGATVRPRGGGPPKASTKNDFDAGWDLPEP